MGALLLIMKENTDELHAKSLRVPRTGEIESGDPGLRAETGIPTGSGKERQAAVGLKGWWKEKTWKQTGGRAI